MATMSTVTASTELDPTLGNDVTIATQICIVIAIHGNGTLLDSTFFREEDVIKLCIGLEQEHLRGVLQILDTKTILASSSSPSMMAAS